MTNPFSLWVPFTISTVFTSTTLLGLLVLGASCASTHSTTSAKTSQSAKSAAVDRVATTTPILPITQIVQSKESKAFTEQCDQGLKVARHILADFDLRAAEVNGGGDDIKRTVNNVLNPINNLWIAVDKGLNSAALFANVHPQEAMRNAAEQCERDFSKLITDIGLSRSLFDALSHLDASAENQETQRYVKNLLRDFRRSGVNKDEPTRNKIKILNEKIVKLGQVFGKNIREDVRILSLHSVADLKGLPQDYIDSHAPNKKGVITITTDYPDYIPFMKSASNDENRLALYKLFRKRGYPQNINILQQLISKRHDLATLLGYKTWAAYVTEDKMIGSAENAHQFIDRINTLAKPRAMQDYKELLKRLQQDDSSATQVGDWQKSYISSLVRKEQYNLDNNAVRKYFTYAKVRDGIFAITGKMFGVRYKETNTPTWAKSVKAYELIDIASGNKLASFYLDMHPRDNKYKHAAAFPLITGVSEKQLPKATLVCNFPADGPMEHGQVETFFHEFGHLLHHMLGGDHRWLGVSGFNTEWDFVEAPSQMLEEWALDYNTLKLFASNDSGDVIPKTLVESMKRAANFGKGTDTRHQMFYAAMSLNFYDTDPSTLNTTAKMKELQETYSPFPYVDNTYMQTSFGHLDGYSAIYYTYMWSKVIAKDMFSVFAAKGLLNQDAASRYRKYILAQGGAKDAAVMVKEFLGRDYTFDSFATWLNEN